MVFSICITIYYSRQVCHPGKSKEFRLLPCTSFIGDHPRLSGYNRPYHQDHSIIGSFIAHMFHILDMLSIFIHQKFRFEPRIG